MPASAQVTLQYLVEPTVLDVLTPAHTAGLRATAPFGITVEPGEAFLHRLFYPEQSDYDSGGSGSTEGFRLGNFPALENTGPVSAVAVQDWQGQPISFTSLRFLAIEVKPRYPSVGVKATGTLTSTGVEVADGDTVTIGAVTYRFKNTMAAVNDVQRDGTAATTLANLQATINLTGSAGTEFYVGTAIHPTVRAGTATATTVPLTAVSYGDAGNALATTEASTVLSFGAATLTGGLDFADPVVARGLEGSVLISIENDLLPGTSVFTTEVSAPTLLTFGSGEDWTPGATGKITVTFTTSEPAPATDQDVNAVVTLILIGTP